jgi:hypothetical protein
LDNKHRKKAFFSAAILLPCDHAPKVRPILLVSWADQPVLARRAEKPFVAAARMSQSTLKQVQPERPVGREYPKLVQQYRM